MELRTYPEYSKNYPLTLKNCMKRPLQLYPDDAAVVYRDNAGEYFRFTWKEWYGRTCQLAHALKAMGVKSGTPREIGDRIATMALNHHWHLETIYATTCIGAVSHPINVRLSLDHMAYTINHAGDRIVFVDEDVLPLAELLYDKIKDTVETFIYMSNKPGKPDTKIEPLILYEDLIKGYPKTFEWPDFHEDTHSVLYYTTGTTGLPKGALFTHRQQFLSALFSIGNTGMAVRLPDDPPRPNKQILMVNVPLFHIHAWQIPFTYVFSANTMVFPGRFTPESFCELVDREKVTSTAMVPTMLAMLIEYPDFHKYDMSSLINVVIGGAALPAGLKAKAEEIFPNFSTSSGYGMTETLAGSITAAIKRNMVDWPKEEIDKVRVKTGLAMPGIDARVIDENGNDVPHDNETIGEIVLRGHWITEQYFKEPEKSAESWRGGWFHTGDAAKIDQDGYIIIVDRITDVIRSGAEMVPTVLLENLTASCDFVLETAYVGVPDDKWGERPMCLVKKVPGSDKTARDIIKYLEVEGVEKGKITKWMLPHYVVFTDDIPMTSVGKWDKIAIRKKIDEYTDQAEKLSQS